MADFKKAINFILENEGGKSNRKEDRGGTTNYGLTDKFLKRIGHPKKAYDLTQEEAIGIYEKYLWSPELFSEIKDQRIATEYFDFFINAGEGNATKVMQRACNKLLNNSVVVDGNFGKATLHAINAVNPEDLHAVFEICQQQYFKDIVKNDPTQLSNLNGWLNRAKKAPK